MRRIYGRFRDIKNTPIDIEIINTTASGEDIEIGEDLFFSGDPVTIESNVDNTFECIIRKNATINLVTKEYAGEYFFANNARSVTVKITRDGDVIFNGFLEPNTFSQGYALPLEEFSLNCTDFLSTLQYLNYNDTNIHNYEDLKSTAGNISFKNILYGIFSSASNAHVYYDMSKGLEEGEERHAFEQMGINENFIYGETFDDVMTQEEVLQQILQYFNLHIIQEGNDFFIFDWESIRNGNTQWYDILNDTRITEEVNLIRMTSDNHADDATNITVADVYTQIQVKS